ncbi:MAG: tetratricopeptide repeat protein [bacterium]|nr:tetratricopeptide repeat protein [candidate division KSB1 bacterium]MDH7561165.1 tetratricopeptide repeat protein [bacterium]
MASVGLNSDLVIGGRRFHVQTSLCDETGELSATVFEEGRLVERVTRRLAQAASAEEAQQEVASLHREASEGVRLLFDLCDKLRELKHAPSHNRLGLLLLGRGFFDEAQAQFRLAIELDEKVPEYHKNLGDVYMAQKQYEQAVACYQRGLEGGEDYADLHRALGRAYWAMGSGDKALVHLRQAVALNPRYGAALLDIATVLLERLMRQKAEPAVAHVAEVAELTRKALRHRAGDSERLAEALHALHHGRLQLAWELMRLASAGDAQSSEQVEHELLLRLVLGGSNDGAAVERLVGELERLTAQHAKYADLHNSLGVAYLIQGRNCLLRAAEEFKEALRINPRFRTAKRNLRLVENDGRGFLILLRTLLK